MVGSIDTRLIVLRGNSGSGKSTTARYLREQLGRGVAWIEQDYVRRIVLREHGDGPVNAGLIAAMVRHTLDAGYHVILDGILNAVRYREMLVALTDDHVGRTRHYYFDLPFDETVRRHATRALSSEFSAEQMQEWYRPRDVLDLAGETVIGPDRRLEEIVNMIIGDGLPEPPVLARASPSTWIT